MSATVRPITSFHGRMEGRRNRGSGARSAVAIILAALALLLLMRGLAAGLPVGESSEEAVAVMAIRPLPPPPLEPPPPTEQPPPPPALPPLDLALPSLEPMAITIPELPVAIDLAALPLNLPLLVSGESVADTGLGELDEPASVMAGLDLESYYPRIARQRRIEGKSLVRVQLAADGRVLDAQILHSEPEGIFDRSALLVARQAPYRPARRGGVAVASSLDLPIIWRFRP